MSLLLSRHTRRRDCVVFLIGAVAWPLGAGGQPIDRMRRVGVIMSYRESDPEAQKRLAAFVEALRQAGWVHGHNMRLEVRWFDGDRDRAKAEAAELVQMAPDVIVANGTPAVAALRTLTSSIPVVFAVVTDPVGAGFVQDLSRPGGNMTGFSTFEPEIGGKWLELLNAISPGLRHVGVLMDPDFRSFDAHWRAIQAIASSLGVNAEVAYARHGTEIDEALAGIAKHGNPGLIVLPTPVNSVHREQIFSLTAQLRVPAMYPFAFHARSGGLIAYGFDGVDLFRRAGPYVGRILNGERPGDLPVQAPTRYELVVNLRTARGLGIEVPPSLLARADEVIE